MHNLKQVQEQKQKYTLRLLASNKSTPIQLALNDAPIDYFQHRQQP